MKYYPADNTSRTNLHPYIAKIAAHEAQLTPSTESAAIIDASLPADELAAEDEMQIEQAAAEDAKKNLAGTVERPLSVLPEVEIFIGTLILTTLMRYNMHQDAALASALLMQRCSAFNRRSLDVIASKVHFYFSLSFENVNRLADIRPTLLKFYRTACVRHDEVGQAVLLNLLLRNFLHYNMVEQARLLSSRTVFPENASNNQFCRFLYYMGRIQALQLEYPDAYKRLLWATRKAPQDSAIGFKRIVTKLTIIVQLLMGEIPDRSVFNDAEHRVALLPYFELTKAVRSGDIQAYHAVVQRHGILFKQDKNLGLIQRLGHNVVKIGLKKISVSYSRISLADICKRLVLPSVQGAEYICAKAIRDGVIDATIDHDNSTLLSNESVDLYATEEPQRAFHARIGFCLDVHNDAVKAMRYPGDSGRYKIDNKDSKADDEADEKTIEDLIREMNEED